MQTALRRIRIVVLMLAGGCAAFLVAAAIFRPEPTGELPLISYVAMGWGIVVAGLRVPVAGRVEASGRRRIAEGSFEASRPSQQQTLVERHGDEGRLLLVFQTRAIIGAALLEGAGLFCAAAAFAEGRWLPIGVGAVLCVLILIDVPTEGRWREWREAQERLLHREREARTMGS